MIATQAFTLYAGQAFWFYLLWADFQSPPGIVRWTHAERKHPAPSRTRQLSFPQPMVVWSSRHVRVGIAWHRYS